ncbi:MFS transporter [Natrialba asiatica]|uniref:Major Facilitator Superfamily transporter n=1 Tax=Natrialba asiatica (strain ATCC 700177 / DSM 12278 / JCM 9576 / FERM P-10747 / NBRC 102637 / 172P1) TaxID=29540 RepID=M0AKG5_NATA1|nr:MFS transporter [Natrialba asiatica]ELY98417.1 Major Facilitator Superfamily transporter [Natrialba asiatica DSM 12278]
MLSPADRLPNTTILTYYGYQATDSVGFIWPVFTLFLLWNDLSFTRIGLLSAISAVLIVLLEVPTGYVADRIGRRNALALGMTSMTASVVGFVVADAYWQFVVLYSLWAVSIAFQSGTADAWLYETLATDLRNGDNDGNGDYDEFTRVRGRGGAIYEYTSAVTMIAGGLLYVAHPTYPFVASAALHACGIGIVLSLPQNTRGAGETIATDRVGVRESLSIIRTDLLSGSLRPFVAFIALFFAVVNAADTFIQPIAEAVLGRVLDSMAAMGASAGGGTGAGTAIGATGLPEPALLGVLYACFAVVSAIASDSAARVRELVGIRAVLVWVPVAVAVALVAPAVLPLLAIPAFVFLKGAAALSKPLVTTYVNDRIGSTGRATVLSAMSMCYAVVRAPLKPVAGYVADLTGPLETVALLGGFFLLGGATLSLVSARRVVSAERHTTPSERT